MKRMIHKALSLILSLTMLVSMVMFNGITVLASDPDVWDGIAIDTSWYDAGNSSFTITTGAQLAGLAQLVNGGNDFSTKTVTLGADIDLYSHNWTPIGIASPYFIGTFDGAGHTISGIAIGTAAKPDSALPFVGLFGYVRSGSTIENVSVNITGIYSSFSEDYASVGGLVGFSYGDISNCYATGAVIGGDDYAYVGGLVGGNSSTISGSYATGDVTGGDDAYAGGLVGYIAITPFHVAMPQVL